MSTSAIQDPNKCDHCGGYHTGQCPRVAAIEYHPNGTIKRVEYHAPQPVDWQNIKIGQAVSAAPAQSAAAPARTDWWREHDSGGEYWDADEAS